MTFDRWAPDGSAPAARTRQTARQGASVGSPAPVRPAPDPSPAPTPEPGDRMRRWLAAVDAARELAGELNAYRHRIVDLALSVCDIVHGGGAHWSKHEDLYTLRRFAKETGIHYRTLWNWVDTRRNVIDVLPKGEYREEDFKFALRTHKNPKVRGDRQKTIDEFRKQRDGRKTHYRLSSIVQWALSHRKFVRSQDLAQFERDELEALLAVTEDTATALRTFLRS